MAGALAAKLKATSDAFLATPADAGDVQKTAQNITSLARASIALHQMQAQENKAAEQAEAGVEERQVAKTRARVHRHFHPDEDDDTDMNEHDPRLDDSEAMAAARAELGRRLDAIALEIKAAGAPRRSVRRDVPGAAEKLVRPEPAEPTPPAH